MTLVEHRFRPAFLGTIAASILMVWGAAQPSLAEESLAFRQALAEAAAETPALAAFYVARDYAPIWTTAADAERRGAFFAALDRSPSQGLPAARYDAEGLRTRFESVASERQRARLEAAVSATFLTYAKDVGSGVLEPQRVDSGIVREVALREPQATIAGFAMSTTPARYLAKLAPDAPQYAQLLKAKGDLEAAMAAGGWGARIGAGKLQPGDSGAAVVELRDRLIRMGYLGRTATRDFDATIQKAVQEFQRDNGLSPDGVAGEGTIALVNLEPVDRLKSVLVALERLRWMNGTTLGERHVWVNIPDFTAKIIDNGKVTFETVTVVGMNQEDRRTPEFSDQMEYMVINPTWNVPRSITVKEYLPMLQKNRNAVAHLKIVDRRGRVVDRNATDFTRYTARSFPFSISQPPSDDNALGLVKFMFPNKWNIYLHDTPTKSLFEKEIRAYSHGCIRLGAPFDFAYTLLTPQSSDPVGEFRAHLVTKAETSLRLKVPVPVHLVYFTAWPTAKGRIDYRRDAYGRDQRIFDALQDAGVVLPVVQG
ncbi:MAG: L,D-transpeptidase family protein [Proteobacteria bacterium]|nr:L,D-transpeptidase family protein [Pseudomonadota bacterium]